MDQSGCATSVDVQVPESDIWMSKIMRFASFTVYSIYEVPLEVSLTSYVRCTVQSLVDILSDILIRLTLARLHKNDSSQNNPN